ncbi:hypothetical protein EDC04DRAFT_2902341 [Pisolithus marmoratus]|nr:hypothetical protein EDC04DRAFT_2902341 [Pisolithus marmoratus]
MSIVRNESLMSSSTSEAVVDSQDCEILGAEVEELKEEMELTPLLTGTTIMGLGTESGSADNSLICSSTTRFDAAHFSGAHVDAQFPRLHRFTSTVAERAATESSNASNKQRAEMSCNKLRFEKE